MTDKERADHYQAALRAIALHTEAQEDHHRCQFCLWVSKEALEKC